MANAESSQRNPDVDSSFSIPRGGPIFVPDFVTPQTRVSNFESEVFHLLESLKAELGSEPDDVDEDISVDELKIYSDEELVSEAMRIAFEDDQMAGTPSDDGGNLCSSGAEDDHRGLDLDKSASSESSGGYSSDPSYDGEENDTSLKKQNRRAKAKTRSKNKRKRKLVNREKDKQNDETYLAKVEYLAKLRQKQEEDKASVRLHSFKNDDNTLLSSGNITLKCLELFSFPLKGKCSLTGKHVPIRYPEVILCVEVYHNKQSSKKTQELLVLGSQVLTELRDKIRCLTDVVMQKAGDHDPSGYFLIEDVFCNDMRDPSAIDYSEPVLDWLRNAKEEALAKWNCILSGIKKSCRSLLDDKAVSKLPNFRSVKMEKIRFCDLRFRLGAGYLYCHQGDCKHIIVIRDMRLVHPEDVQNRAAYPLVVYQPKAILKKCSVCHIYKATKVTLDDKLAGENPCYFCDNCYYLLHYSADGTLLYDRFQVYDYLQDYY